MAEEDTTTKNNPEKEAGLLDVANEPQPTVGFQPYVPSIEDRRQRALELAVGFNSNDHREPINSVLARAKAYHEYVVDGTTPAGV